MDCVVEGLQFPNVYADLRFSSDKSTYKQNPFNPEIGLAFVDIKNLDGTPFELCPRTLLKRACKELLDLGLEIKAGIEIEFTVLKDPIKMEAIETGTYMSFSSLSLL